MENFIIISRIISTFLKNTLIAMLTQIKAFKFAVILTLSLITLALFACKDPSTDANDDSGVKQASLDLSQKWSKTSPPINIHHIFLGDINKRGKPTGFHSRPKGKDPKSARLKRIQSKPNKAGVYTARIEVFNQSTQQWREKFSSLFPDKLSANEVISAISHAYSNRDKSKKQPWSGPSGLGFPIQGYVLNNGKINTAFPVFTKD